MADIILHFLLFELFSSLFEPDLDLRLRISGSLSRGLSYFGAISLPRGLPSFGAISLSLGARRRRDFLKLMLSAVCCNKFLTLWDPVSSVFEVSFWAEAFEP